MDTQRTVLWLVFGLSLILLWDRWQVYQGRNSTFRPAVTAPAPLAPSGAAPRTPGDGPAPNPPATVPSAPPAARPGGPAEAAPPGSRPRIHTHTGLAWAEVR